MNKSHVKYISGLLLFGLNGIISAQILLTSSEIVFYRTLFGSLFLIVLFCLTPKHGKLFAYPKQLLYVVLSGISMGLSWIFLYEAYQRIGVGLSSITYYCGPVIVMLLAPLTFHKKFTFRQILCFVVVFVGILLVSAPDLIGSNTGDLFGLFCGFASAILHAMMVIFTMKAPDITGLKNSMLQMVVSFLVATVFTITQVGLTLPTSPAQWGWILFLGIVNSGIGCYLYFSEIAKLPVITVSILGYLEPLSAVFFAVILLHESLSLPELIGAVLILGGAIASEISESRPKQPAPTQITSNHSDV